MSGVDAETEDSRMLSSPDESDNEQTTTPVNQTLNPSSTVPSPPDSQRRETRSSIAMPTAPSGASIANSNGKRPIMNISNGVDDMEELQAMANGKARQDLPVRTHPTGYQYSKPEDEPGYAWLNKKAQDEANRAWDGMQHKQYMIKNTYGDPFELVEHEQAILASLKK